MDGQVRDINGKPVAGAVVDVWHANTLGGYSFFDPSHPKYNLRRRIETDTEGRYKFRSLLPSGYACPPNGQVQKLLDQLGRHGNRPAHIHFFVSAPDYRKLTTQINIDGDAYLHDDLPSPHVTDHPGGSPSTEPRRSARRLNARRGDHLDFTPIPKAPPHQSGSDPTHAEPPDDRSGSRFSAGGLPPAFLEPPRMPDTILFLPADLRHDLTISEIKSTIVDVPTVRKHKLSSLSVTAQSYVIVELRLGNGVIGIGEAATLGGPRWSEESVESIKTTIGHTWRPRSSARLPIASRQPASAWTKLPSVTSG